MKSKLLLAVIFLISFQMTALTQPCLPEGITFELQIQIDNFQTNHPGCTEIEGDVFISGSNITNLNGLSVLTYIAGTLTFYANWSLTSLTGLEGLTAIGEHLEIMSSGIGSLAGLNNLTSVGGNLQIFENDNLTSLTGMDNLTSVGGGLEINYNNSLPDLNGLEGLTSIGGNLAIWQEYSLSSLSGLNNITTIGGELYIYDNNNLVNLTGLENIDAASIANLSITYNPSLSSCEVQSICDYLVSPGGTIEIHDNAPGCNSQSEVEEACGITSCLPEGIAFTTQVDIDNFQTDYPGCKEIEGNVVIAGNEITSLNGLSTLTSIGGDLLINNNSLLVNLTGLDNVTFIGGDLMIGDDDNSGNPVLTSLTGLEGLLSIGGNLGIINNSSLTSLTGLDNLISIWGNLNINNDYNLTSLAGLEELTSIGDNLVIYYVALTSLTGLDNLTTIGENIDISFTSDLMSLTGLESLNTIRGDLQIYYNDALNSLTGLDNIDAGTINDLDIVYNETLSTCDVQSICDYLTSPGGTIEIHDNATGCNSQEEVETACESTSIMDLNHEDRFSIYPNPSSNQITITFSLEQPVYINLKIINNMGQIVATILDGLQPPGEQQIIWNTTGIPAGVYFYRLTVNSEQRTANGKVMVVR